MFYERECQEQTNPDLAADTNLLAASPGFVQLGFAWHLPLHESLPVAKCSTKLCTA